MFISKKAPKRRQKQARRKRVSRFEALEQRRLLAAAVWHNVLHAQDVNRDGMISVRDALNVINELAARTYSDPTTGQLVSEVADGDSPFNYDVNCDAHATPIDALHVINHLRVPGRSQRFDFQASQGGGADGNFTTVGCHAQLNEGTSLRTELSTSITLPTDSSGVLVRFDTPQFDTASIGRMQDAFEITVTDVDGNRVTQPFSPGNVAALNWSEQSTVAMGSASTIQDDTGTSASTHEAIINLAHLDAGTMVNVHLQLLNNDEDDTTSVLIRDVESVAVTDDPPIAFESEFAAPRSLQIDTDGLIDVSPSFQVDYGRSSYAADGDQVSSEVMLTYLGQQPITSNLIGAFDQFTDADLALMPPDGFLPDGRPYYDFSGYFDNELANSETTRPRAFRFNNPGDERFDFRLSLLAGINRPPNDFTSTPLDEIGAGDTYRYSAVADDPDGDSLTYSVVTGPEGLQIDADSGVVAWETTATDVGNHNVILQATDPHGLSSQQAFTIEVAETLQNRPPNFVTDPTTEAIASSGFEITTVATGDSPAGVVAISGFQGPRLVSINAGDQTVSVHAGENNDRFDDLTVYSTGEPVPTDALFDVGYSVDVGLPEFKNPTDSNAVLGMDQADLNGDGHLDLVTMTRHLVVGNGSSSTYFINTTRVLGDGNGNFSSPELLASTSVGSSTEATYFRNLVVGDINGDGHQDVMALQYTTPNVFSILGNGDSSFQPVVTTEFDVNLGDFRLEDLDQDGNLDVVGRLGRAGNIDTDDLVWKRGVGDGTFLPTQTILGAMPGTTKPTRPYQVIDFDGDGDKDIVTANSDTNDVDILLNDGSEQFTVSASIDPDGNPAFGIHAVHVADFTGDGQLDILVNPWRNHELDLFVGDGTGTNFTHQVAGGIYIESGNSAGSDGPRDVDGDGDLDLVFTSAREARDQTILAPQVLINDGSGNFTRTDYPMLDFPGHVSEQLQPGGAFARGAMFGDYNSDGILDLVFSTDVGSTRDFSGVGIRLGTRPGEFGSSRSIPFVDGHFADAANLRSGDFNGDGIVDLLAPHFRQMFLGNGDGTFADPFPTGGSVVDGGANAVADFNQDGLPDYVVGINDYDISLANGDGTFEVSDQVSASENGGYSAIRIADFNNDGYPDFVAGTSWASAGRPFDVHLNDADDPGTFDRTFRTRITAQGVNVSGFLHSLTVGDYNEDGHMDFATVDRLAGESMKLVVFAGDGQGDFTVAGESFAYAEETLDGRFPSYSAGDLESGDLNEDGYLDIVSFTTYGPLIHLGNGDGTFETTDRYPNGGFPFGGRDRFGYLFDLDEDGHMDMVRMGDGSTLQVNRGFGDGTFDVASRINILGGRVGQLSFADLDHDGHVDVVHTNTASTNPSDAAIYSGVRDGLVDGLAIDLNGDGNEEILAVNEHNDRLKILVGDNLGNFTRLSDLLTGRAPKAVTTADLNADGVLELITANRAGRSLSVFSGSVADGYVSQDFALDAGAIDIASADLDGDDNVDLVALDDASNALWIYAGDGTTTLGTPTALALGDRPGRFILEDATGDGLIDAVVTLPDTNRLMILPNRGVGFQPATFGAPIYVTLAESPSDVAVVDLNGDGNLDLVTTLPDVNVLSVLYGRGGNQFAKAQQIRVGENPTRVSLTDADEDGRTDLLVTNSGDSTTSVIYNRFDPNEVYRYDSDAIDPDDDTLTYDIVDGPGGLIVNSDSGELLWAASPDQVGVHDVTISADDGRGGVATQSFKIDVQPARENAAPLIATEPTTRLGAGETFTYQVAALDNDRDTVRYRLIDGPDGATLDPTTGQLTWDGRDVAMEFLPRFNASSIEIPSDPSLNPESITVEGWFNLNDLPRFQYLMRQSGLRGSAYSLHTREENGVLRFEMSFESSDNIRIDIPFQPETNRWRHYAFTYDHTTGAANVFLDGQLTGTGSVSPQPIGLDPLEPTVVGAISSNGTRGQIDNYRIWNYARSPQEIQEGLGRQYDGDDRLVLDFRFDGLETRNIRDFSTAENEGYRLSVNGDEPQLSPGLTDSGMHSFTIGVEDGRGGYDEQSFELEVMPELRGSIVGRLFDDLDGDGSQDDGSENPAESGLVGWQLFIDTNGNTYPDPSEPQTTTDASGDYRFDGLLPGEYPVRVSPVAGYDVPATETNVSVTASAETAFDLAIEQLSLSHIRGQLLTEDGDAIAYWKTYADLDDDGQRDESEPMAMSDRDGNYAITGLDAGTYTIRTDLPAGWADTAGRDGLTVTLAADEVLAGNDFTLEPTNTSVTGGVHFVTMPRRTIEARQTFRYASIAMGVGDQAIRYDLSLSPDGMTVDPQTGLVAWRPTIGQIGEHLAVLRATDASGSISLQDFSVEVTAPNTAPVIVAPGTANTSEPQVASRGFSSVYANVVYLVDVLAQDAESSALTYALQQSPSGAAIDPSTGRLSWTPAASAVGSHDFTVDVTDEHDATTSATWTVDVTNDSPIVLPLQIQLPRATAAITNEYFSRISAVDAIGRPVTWQVTSAPAGMSTSPDGIILWTPANDQWGLQNIELLATTADGDSQPVVFDVEVFGRALNAAPTIDSVPTTSVSVGQTFEYDLLVSDSDRDVHAFTLLVAPVGMSVHPLLGLLRWTPAADQLGEHDITVQVSDPSGDTDEQTFKLKVSRFGGPPSITSVPPTEAAVGSAFLYSVEAADREGDPLSYTLLASPVGMSIVEATGEISWTPAVDQVGLQDIVIQVSDGIGGAATQAFVIAVSAGIPNLPPLINSASPRFGAVGTAYHYTLSASDPENTTLTYSLRRGPSGMTVNASSGLVSWTPAADQTGKHVVTLVATDAGGASAVESFEFDVLAANRAPEITSDAPLETVAGAPFRYDVLVRDDDSDPITFELTTAPAGATIDPFGRITWETSVPLIGQHDFVVVAGDPRGGSDVSSFTVNVIEDLVPPKVSLVISPDSSSQRVLPWAGPFTAYVKAVDNVAVRSLTLAANGQDISLDAWGTATFTFEDWGIASILATATAVDTNNNTTTKQTGFRYGAPLGWDELGDAVPTAEITSPADADSVTGMVSIVGTAAHDEFASYSLSYRKVDDTAFTQFHDSATAVTNGELGVWDTSLLLNDEYVIRLEVTTTDGVVNIDDHNVGLGGNLKLGNFTVSFTDLVVPVAGIPIELTRMYDTLQADRRGDFGQGWRMEYRNTDLRVGLPESGLEDIGIHTPFRPGVKVYLNVPGEGRQGFTFTPEIRVLPGFGNNLVLGRPRFTPDYGVTSTLSTGINNFLLVDQQGNFFAPGKIPYNPASPLFGGAFRLTTADGTRYSVDGNTGLLSTATDRNGNSITFDEDGIRSELGVAIEFERDSLGRIIQMTDPVGNVQKYQYDSDGNLVEHSDPDGFVTQYKYETGNRLSEVIDPLGRLGSRSEYDADGRLISFTGADGRRIDLQRDVDTLQELITDGLGNTTVIESDNNGNIVRVTDALGGVTTNTYDDDGNQTSTTNPAGEMTRRKFDADGNLIESIDPTGVRSTFTFNAQRELASSTDGLGRTSELQYDDSGNLARVIDATGAVTKSLYDEDGNLLSTTDAAGNVSRYEYDSSGYVIAEIDQHDHRTDYSYNAKGDLLSITDPLGGTTQFSYDSRGNVTATTDPLGHTTLFGHDALSAQVSETDPLGNVTLTEVDGNGNLRVVIDALGNQRTRQYDASNNLTEFTNQRGQSTEYEYDTLARLVKTIDAEGNETEIEYDDAGRVHRSVNALGHATAFQYDRVGRNVGYADALGNSTAFQYDAVGNLIAELDPDGNKTIFEYDELDRLIRIVHPDGGIQDQRYDELGNLTRVIDPLGNTVIYGYDANNNLSAVIDASGAMTKFAYDANNQLVSQTDPLGRVTRFRYDANGQRIEKTLPDGNIETTSHDAAGRVATTTDANGDSTTIVTNAIGQVLRRTFQDGSREEFTYTPTGRTETATNIHGTVSYRYDGLDRLERVTNPDGNYVAYRYDAGSNRTSVQTNVDGESQTTTYAFDEVNRIASVTDPDSQVMQYSYDSRGNLLVTASPNGVQSSYTYDSMNRTLGLSHVHDSEVLESYQYTYNVIGDRITAENADGSRVEYAYDANRRLVRESRFDSIGENIDSSTYTYDDVGNRIREVDENGSAIEYEYNINDQLIREGETTYTYDANGNLIARAELGETTTYQFDFENHLVGVIGPDGQVSYQHDAAGERISRTDVGSRINFLVDVNNPTGVSQVLVEYDSDDNAIAEYTYGNELIGQDRGGVNHYHHFDANDNVRFLTDRLGNVTDTYSFTAFGESVETNGSTENVYRFGGQRYENTEDLGYFRARSYDAHTGRFISRDPFEGALNDPVSLHRYLYANSNPVMFRDPTGLLSLMEVAVASSTLATIQTSYSSALASVFQSSVNIADDYITVGAKGRDLVFQALSVGVFSPGLMNILVDSNNTIANGFLLISKAAKTELIKFGFSLFSGPFTKGGKITKGAFKDLEFQFDFAGIAGEILTGGGADASVGIPGFPQLGPLANLVKSTSAITETALKDGKVDEKSVASANELIKDLFNSFHQN